MSKQFAVIYCRVSSAAQIKKGDGIGSQETRCREYARHRNYEVVEVFRDEGVSGGVVNRPGMITMLKFIRQMKREQIVIIIDDISRLARDLGAHLELRTAITAVGAKLESPSIEFGEDSDSILVENLLASVSQHNRQKNAEQVKHRMRARMMNGYFCFHPPVGYKYERVNGHGKLLVKDEPVASVVKEALESFASGHLATQSEVMRFLQNSPVFTNATQPRVHPQKVQELLERVLYAGILDLPEWDITLLQGKHEPLISFDTWQKVQARLQERAKVPARKDIAQDFPLRGFIVCDECKQSMTSCWSAGRTGKYAYYHCHTKGCPEYKKSIRREILENDFEAMLRELKPTPELFGLLKVTLEMAWKESLDNEAAERKALKDDLRAAEHKLEQVVNRIMDCDSPIVIKTYEQQVRKLEEEKLRLGEKISNCGRVTETFDEAFRTGFKFLADPHKLWVSDKMEDKQIVLKLTFTEQLAYKRKEGFRTAALALPFLLLEDLKGDKSGMVEDTGIEPATFCLQSRRSTN